MILFNIGITFVVFVVGLIITLFTNDVFLFSLAVFVLLLFVAGIGCFLQKYPQRFLGRFSEKYKSLQSMVIYISIIAFGMICVQVIGFAIYVFWGLVFAPGHRR